MPDLYLKQKLRGLFGVFNDATVATETDEQFNVQTEVERLGVRTENAFYLPSVTADTTSVFWSARTKKLIRSAKIIPQAALATSATNYFTYKLQRTDGTTVVNMGTITTSSTALAAGTPVSFTLSSATCAASTSIQLLQDESGTATSPAMFVQLDTEEQK